MIDVIQTLKNLNKEFPRFQLETLLKIVECIAEKHEWHPDTITAPTIPSPVWYQTDKVTCNQNCISLQQGDTTSCTCKEYPDAFIHYTTTKNHTPDKTSHNQVITSEGDEASDFSTLEDWLSYQKKGTALSTTYETNRRG